MTIEEVQTRLRAAHARIGHEGRFALTLSLAEHGSCGQGGGQEDCYITHWFRPEPHAFEDCKAVGSGSLTECLAALDRYAAAYQRKPTPDEIARTLGLVSDERPAPMGNPAAKRAGKPRRSPGMMMAAE